MGRAGFSQHIAFQVRTIVHAPVRATRAERMWAGAMPARARRRRASVDDNEEDMVHASGMLSETMRTVGKEQGRDRSASSGFGPGVCVAGGPHNFTYSHMRSIVMYYCTYHTERCYTP
jgi:hypothetical protein